MKTLTRVLFSALLGTWTVTDASAALSTTDQYRIQGLQVAVDLSKEVVSPGDISIVTITASNAGPATLEGVYIEITIPQFLKAFLGYRVLGRCGNLRDNCIRGAQLTWDLGQLPPGQSRIVMFPAEVDLSAPAGAIISFVPSVHSGDTSVATIAALAVSEVERLQVAVFAPKESLSDGSGGCVYVVASNPTMIADALGTLRVFIDGNVKINLTSDGGMHRDNLVEWPVNVRSGESKVEYICLHRADDAWSGALTQIRAVIETQSGLGNASSRTLAITDGGPLHLHVFVAPSHLRPGREASAVVTVSNSGPAALENPMVYVSLPGRVGLFEGRDIGGSCGFSLTGNCGPGDQVVFRWPAIPAGESRSRAIPILSNSELLPGTFYEPAARFGELLHISAGARAGAFGAHSSSTVVVHESPAIAVGVVLNNDVVRPGDVVDAELVISNRGTKPESASRILVVTDVGGGLTVADHGASGNSKVLEPGEVLRMNWMSHVAPAFASGSIATVTLLVDALDSWAVYSAPVVPRSSASLQLEQIIVPSTVIAGSTHLVDLELTNVSPAEFDSLRITAVVPDYSDAGLFSYNAGKTLVWEKRLDASRSLDVFYDFHVYWDAEQYSPRYSYQMEPRPGEMLYTFAAAEQSKGPSAVRLGALVVSARETSRTDHLAAGHEALQVESFPNPFFDAVKFSSGSSCEGHTTLKIFDLMGRIVALPYHRYLSGPSEPILWNAATFPPGPYMYQLTVGNCMSVGAIVHTR